MLFWTPAAGLSLGDEYYAVAEDYGQLSSDFIIIVLLFTCDNVICFHFPQKMIIESFICKN